MLMGGRRFRATGACAWILLLWFILPAPIFLLDSFHSPLPPGILDGDDDAAALTSLSNLELKILAPIPSPPPDLPQRVGEAAPVETGRPAPSVVPLPTPSRSPPLG